MDTKPKLSPQSREILIGFSARWKRPQPKTLKASNWLKEWWAVSLVNAVPYAQKKKGADTGIDGLIYFKPDGKTTEKAIVSVKGGNVGVPMVRDLRHVVDRERAKIGIFITLAEPTNPMKVEAVKVGSYETPFGEFPKLQIYTIRDLFGGVETQTPLDRSDQFQEGRQRNI
jgi:Restriction endonuclease